MTYNGFHGRTDRQPDGRFQQTTNFSKLPGVNFSNYQDIEHSDIMEKSKRQAFRFRCSREPVFYRTAYEEGEALLKNISSEGCALEWSTNPPERGEKILLRLEFFDSEIIEIQAQVVRVEENDFAVKFLIIEASAKRAIRNYFAKRNHGR